MFVQIIQKGKKTFYVLSHSLYVCKCVCDVHMIGLKLTSRFARESLSIQKRVSYYYDYTLEQKE